jgi:Lon protease-like protein
VRAVEEFKIYLFPIPGSVSFPNTSVPLHVFEPRYRALIKDAIRDQVRVGVCHTEGVISPAKPHDTLEESLKSNQATYEPCPVFSAGFAEIIDITTDGRILTEIKMDARYEMIEEIQTLPYRIVKCVRYDDLAPESDERSEQTKNLRHQINENLLGMTEELREELTGEQSTALSDEDYSFKIFQTIRFEPDLMQEVLEMRTPADRLRLLYEVLSAEPTEEDELEDDPDDDPEH